MNELRDRLSRNDLWQAIENAPLPGIEVPKTWFSRARLDSFQDRLRSVHGLTEFSAARLNLEYRRFLYLKALDGGTLTPSHRVDQAWHLHIDTPDGAWPQFCDEVMGRRVEHRTGLTKDEASASYTRTLDLYRREFRREPPGDIWPGEEQKRRRKLGHRISTVGSVIGFGGSLVAIMVDTWLPWTLLAPVFAGGPLILYGDWICEGTDLTEEAGCG